MRLTKKILSLTLVLIVMLGLTACDINDVVHEFPTALSAIKTRNADAIEKCRALGLISETDYTAYTSALQKQVDDLIKESSNDSIDDTSGWGNLFLNAITYVSSESGGQFDNFSSAGIAKNSNPVAIDMFAESSIADMNGVLNLEIWVLKYDSSNGGKSLDDIKAIVDKCKADDGKDATLEGKLLKYFKDSGTTLFDSTKIPVVKDTVANTSSRTNDLGKDFMLQSVNGDSDVVDSIAIRIKELNPEFVEKLNSLGNNTEGKYLRYGNHLYLLEYPVEYIKNFNKTTTGGFEITTEKADYSINIWSGEMITSDGVVVTATPNVITGANKSDTTATSTKGINSFFLSGTTSYGGIGEVSATVADCHKIVLRDYDELVYMPGIVDGENLVNLGRRIRIINSAGSGDEVVAKYIDKEGKELVNTDASSIKEIKASDIMSIWSGDTGHETEKIKLPFGSNTVSTSGAITATTGTIEDQKKLLNVLYQDTIECSTRFPGDKVGTSDTTSILGSSAKEIFYGMALDVDMYESGIMTNWVSLDATDARGGLDWWNAWLKNNKYSYTVDRTDVEGWLTGVYAYELGDNDTIILDLETVTKIQQEYDKEDKASYVNVLSTGSIIAGILLIAYAILLCCSWIFDTSVVGGPRTLELLSFGRWIPITSDNDVPYNNVEGKFYMTLSDIVLRALVIVGIGVMLFFIDIVQITDYLVSTLGTIAEKISDVLTN